MSNPTEPTQAQLEICKKYGVVPEVPNPEFKVGISPNAFTGLQPLNGLRHPPEADTCGWYIWAEEEFRSNLDFFEPLHIEHLNELCPAVVPYLCLPPGWRFLIAPDYEDVWEDTVLLNIDQ